VSERPTPLSTAADRRPQFEVRGDVSRTIGRGEASGEKSAVRQRPPGAGLTLRERRVKKILLKELEKLSTQGKTWVSYKERKHLFETLDVAFIDREIAKMEKQLRPRPWLYAFIGGFAVLYAGLQFAQVAAEPLTGWSLVQVILGLAVPASFIYGQVAARRATQRRLWIYQALRELSDAEDLDVQLPESVALADLLIDRIVEAEDEASGVPLRRIRA
jgi:hypothetical protein